MTGFGQVHVGGLNIEVSWTTHDPRYWCEAKDTVVVSAHAASSCIGRLYTLDEQFEQANPEGVAQRDARQSHA